MSFHNISFEIKYKTGIIKIDRTQKLNAINRETLDELRTIFTSIKTDDNIEVMIITGEGEKAFAAGADVAELYLLNSANGKEYALAGQEVLNIIENLEKPVIAAVNGIALGGGCELAIACHIILASSNAKFGYPEVSLGIMPGYGGTQRLPRLINPLKAAELILTGDTIDAEEAYRLGLVNKIYSPDELLNKAIELADKITSKSRPAVKMALKALVASKNMSLKDGLKYEADLFGQCCTTEDFKKGTKAFLEKIKPDFRK